MPRISFNHADIDAWYEKEDEGTSTFDVCTDCFTDGDTAETLGLTDKGYNGDPIPADADAEETGEDHPEIEETDYTCDCCGRRLTDPIYY